MKQIYTLLTVLLFACNSVWAITAECDERLSYAEELLLSQEIHRRMTCSKSMNEAIEYKEQSSEGKKNAHRILAPLCSSENEFTSPCLVMGKDASIGNGVLGEVCKIATKYTPLCILTAKAKNLSDEVIVSSCSNASEQSIQNL